MTIKRFLKKYKDIILLNIYNSAIFTQLGNYSRAIPDKIDKVADLPVSHSILQFFGITSTHTLSTFTHSLPWVWIVSTIVVSVIIHFLKGALKIIIIVALLAIGLLAITRKI
ncbi:hypothetical protein [Pseudolactococcus insecticola]|uniref:Uncharacterized protein n=1 Tax=Pseudolactococcus insecticola TaxID=2709158 RepID=A0A6A0B9I6_9LACT|nr:hypothetical protein [Lactococcus insecticola]GFH41385.1 hypothetical protein Hs20B_17830 [Lactococcus insecticola]